MNGHIFNLSKIRDEMEDTPRGQRIYEFFKTPNSDYLNDDQKRNVRNILREEFLKWDLEIYNSIIEKNEEDELT